MGTCIGVKEFASKFEEFLRSLEGDVSAEVIAKVWNELTEENGWKDRLWVVEKRKVYGQMKTYYQTEL